MAVSGETVALEAHVNETCTAQPCERFLAVTPDQLLQWIQTAADEPKIGDNAVRECLARARRWLQENPWELKKAKSRRAQLNALRPLCYSYRSVQMHGACMHTLDATKCACHMSGHFALPLSADEWDTTRCALILDVVPSAGRLNHESDPV